MGQLRQLRRPLLGLVLGHQGRRPDDPGRRVRARAARPGPRRCSRASCCCRSASRTRTWPSAGRENPLSSVTRRRWHRPTRPPTTDAEEADRRRTPRGAARRVHRASSATPSSTRTSAPATTLGPRHPRRVGAGRRGGHATPSGSTSSTSSRPSTGCPRRSAATWTARRTSSSSAPRPRTAPMAPGYAGGDTRFQVLARVYDTPTLSGVTLKADLPDDDLTVETWSRIYPGADWHERETGRCSASTSTATRPAQHLPAGRLRGPSAAQGLPAARPARQAVAGHRRRRADARWATDDGDGADGDGDSEADRMTAVSDRRQARLHRGPGRRRPRQRRARDARA